MFKKVFKLIVIAALAAQASAQSFSIRYRFIDFINSSFVESPSAPIGPIIVEMDGTIYGMTAGGGKFGTCQGTIYKLSPNNVLTVMHSFCGGNNSTYFGAETGLVADSQGNMYGARPGPISLSIYAGQVFELVKQPSGSFIYKVLYNFPSSSNLLSGKYPLGSLAVGPDGSVYGTTWRGGNSPDRSTKNSFGTVWKLTPTPSGPYTIQYLHLFEGGADRANPEANVVLDDSGNLYGISSSLDSVNRAQNLWKWSSDSGFSVVAVFAGDGPDDGNDILDINSIRFGPDDNLYVSGSYGGNWNSLPQSSDSSCGGIYEVENGSWTKNPVYFFPATLDSSNVPNAPEGCHPGSISFDAAGNIYGETIQAGSGYGTLFKLTPGASGWTESTLWMFGGVWAQGTSNPVTINPANGAILGAANSPHPPISTTKGVIFRLLP